MYHNDLPLLTIIRFGFLSRPHFLLNLSRLHPFRHRKDIRNSISDVSCPGSFQSPAPCRMCEPLIFPQNSRPCKVSLRLPHLLLLSLSILIICVPVSKHRFQSASVILLSQYVQTSLRSSGHYILFTILFFEYFSTLCIVSELIHSIEEIRIFMLRILSQR